MLGIPFNAASYTILQCLLAKMTGTRPGVFHHYFGDTHVYANQLEAAKEHIGRFSDGLTTHSYEIKFKGIPKYRKGDEVKDSVLRDIIPECIEVVGYKPMASIKAPVAV